MADVTQILDKIQRGDKAATDELLPVLYTELRRLAAQKLTQERNSPSLQPTLLVHDAYLRLMGGVDPGAERWDSRGHFFAAAAEAMRRILIEHARSKATQKRGGEFEKVGLSVVEPSIHDGHIDLLALDEALNLLAQDWPEKAKLVELRYFAGMTIAQASDAMGISHATAERYWQFARAFLFAKLNPAS